MAAAVELAFRRAAADRIDPEQRWVVAVSGGADSVALLHLMRRWVRAPHPRPVVAHLDHALRRGSRADRLFVERLAAELGLEAVAGRRDVAAERRRDESPEEAARRVRRAFLLEVCKRVKAAGVVTGHTLDDQAETVLMRLARGADTAGLAGIPPAAGGFVRPLLGIERAALRAWLERRGLGWREDPSNRELRFDRNRVRRLIVPLLQETLNPRAARNLARAAETLRADADYLDAVAKRRFERYVRHDRGGRPVVPAAAFDTDGPIARRVALEALRAAGLDPRRVGSRHVAALLHLAATPGAGEIHLPGKTAAKRIRGEIRFESHR